MRIALANAYRGQVGGAEVYVTRLLAGLAARGHRLAMLYEAEVPPEVPPIVPAGTKVETWPAAVLGPAGALAALADWRPDVVFVQGLLSPELEAAVVAAHPAMLFAHGYYGTCATGRKSHFFPTPRPCHRTFGPACLALHYPRRCGGLSPLAAWQGYRLQAARRALLPRYRAVVVASEAMATEMLRHGVAPERVHRIAPPGPAAESAALPTPEPRPGAAPSRLLFVGRLTELKGPRLLLHAVALAERRLGRRLPVTIAGSGSEEPHLRRLARRLDLAVDFAGWVDEPGLGGLMRAADLLAVPSVWPEPFGLVGIEAAAAGLPAVAFATGGIPDWLTPGVDGELAPADPPTSQGLAAAICRALADPDHHLALRRGALAGAARFALAPHLEALERVFAEVAG